MKSQIISNPTTQRVFVGWFFTLVSLALILASCADSQNAQPIPTSFAKADILIDPEAHLTDDGDEAARMAAIDKANKVYVHVSDGLETGYFIMKDTLLTSAVKSSVVTAFTNYNPSAGNGKFKKGIKKFTAKSGTQSFKLIDKTKGAMIWFVGKDNANNVKYYPFLCLASNGATVCFRTSFDNDNYNDDTEFLASFSSIQARDLYNKTTFFDWNESIALPRSTFRYAAQ